MSKPFTAYTYDDAANLLKARGRSVGDGTVTLPSELTGEPRRPLVAKTATRFYNGDHWQAGTGFIGQLPPPSHPGFASIVLDIQHGFDSENVIKEVVKTHTGGILGREPVWSFLEQEQPDTTSTHTDFENQTGDALTNWWNKRQSLRELQKAVITLLCEGKVVRHLFFPRAKQGQRLTATDITRALDFIYFESVTADLGGVFVDPDTQQDIGVFLFNETDANGDITNQAAELSFLNDAGNTVVKVVRDKGGTDTFGPFQLGGHLLVYELDRDALITEQVQSSQRSLNLAKTMMMRNVNMAGNRERTVTNAKPPVAVQGTDTRQPTGQVPGKFNTGSGAVNFLVGYPIYGEDGKTVVGYTNPNVNIAEPSPVNTFIETIESERSSIYSQCHQRHVLIVDKADTSGRAREVARREFERSLKETKIIVDASGRWLLEAALRLAAQVANQTSKYATLRADFNCLIDAGEPDPAKQQTVVLLRQPGGPANRPLLSDETARNWIGVEDNAAEEAKIDAEAKRHPPAPTPAPVVGQQVPNPDQQTQQLPQVQ